MNFRAVTLLLTVACIATLFAVYNSPESGSGHPQAPSPCTLPLTYRYGAIDQRFDISRAELASAMKKVSSIWSQPMDTTMLRYDPEGKITINFVYTGIQKLTEDEQVASRQIETKKDQRIAARKNFDRLKKQYEDKAAAFRELRIQYKLSVSEYNSLAKKLGNMQTPAPEEKIKLEQLKRKVEHLKSRKSRHFRQLESLRKRINAKAEQLNALVDRENELITNYNESFSGAKTFNQGHYIKEGREEKINIYQFNTDRELQAVLAHEFGHALGLTHGTDPRSIMYYLMNEQNRKDPALSEEDIAAIRQRCF